MLRSRRLADICKLGQCRNDVPRMRFSLSSPITVPWMLIPRSQRYAEGENSKKDTDRKRANGERETRKHKSMGEERELAGPGRRFACGVRLTELPNAWKHTRPGSEMQTQVRTLSRLMFGCMAESASKCTAYWYSTGRSLNDLVITPAGLIRCTGGFHESMLSVKRHDPQTPIGERTIFPEQ